MFFAAVCGTACGPPRIVLPAGPGTPVADYALAFSSASSRCRDVRTFAAELALSGKVGRQKLRGRVLAGFAPGALRIEAPAAIGGPVFILVAEGDRGRLLLAHDRRLLDDAPPADILDALVGVRLAPDDLRALLSGCVKAGAEPVRGRAYGNDWMALDLNGGGDLYLRREAQAGWRVVAGHYSGLDIEYGAAQNGVPSRVQIRSTSTTGHGDVQMSVGLSQVDVNGESDRQQLVSLIVPPGTLPITLEELRSSGPLGSH
jgi:hypothetical protein